ncbi:MAG: ComEC/Rec2 family competence protein, partial [Tenericutes bacterium]|nr:ComEC/Rec2 family competence protein [Mycoplasmatota bacterium]
MTKLKNLLQFDASNYIHLGIIVLLFYISRTSYIGYILLLPEVIFLFKKSKNILVYSLIIILVLNIRFIQKEAKVDNLDFPVSGTVTDVFEDSFYLSAETRMLCYYSDTSYIYPGMQIEVEGTQISTRTYNIIHTFDYEQYLRSKNISYVIGVNEIEYHQSEFNIYLVKYKVSEYINNNFEKKTASYLRLFVLGENSKEYIDNDTAASLGISHLFAISGMHLALMVSFIVYILRRFYLTKETTNIIVIIFLVGFNIITGFKTSIIRASILIIGIFIKDIFKILLTKTDILAFAFVLMLIINPYSFYSLGFQLSYLIAGAIILGQYLFKTSNQISKLIQISIFATLVSLPITLEVNNSFGLIFVLANLFFILYVSYILLPLTFLTFFLPVCEQIYIFIIKIFELGIELFSNLNKIIIINFPTIIHKITFWLILYMLIVNIKNLKKQLLYISLLIVLFISTLFINYPSNRFVRVLDVFQGDAIHIHDNDCDMLIDTGKSDKYNNLVSYFRGNNTKEIDILLITHFHSDHYGELEDIISNLNVKKVYLNDSSHTNISHYEVVEEGFCFSCGTSNFQVLSADTDDSNENNNSIV